MCNKDDQVTSVQGMVQSQVTQVGYGDNSRLVMSKLIESFIDAVGSRPDFLERLLFRSAMPRYEKRVARVANFYYCSRCNVVFFTENGTKHHEPVNTLHRLLRYDEPT